MNFWFILSRLAAEPQFRMSKQRMFSCIPELAQETTRRYVASASSMGFVETVRARNLTLLQLTPLGQLAVSRTLAQWVTSFGEIQSKHFSDLDAVVHRHS